MSESFIMKENDVKLTDREKEVLKLVIQGYSNPKIAKEIIISESTAKAHVCNIMNKLNASSRVEAAVYAVKNNLV